jgi:rhamnose transport system permease protein
MSTPVEERIPAVEHDARARDAAEPWARRLLGRRETVLLALLVAECAVLGQFSPYFLTVDNLLDTSRFFVETGLVALGMTLVIITRGIDLSVGSLLALVSVAVGFSYQAGLPFGVAVAFGVVVGMAGGLFNGLLIARLDLSPLTVTLGTMALFRGIAFAVSDAGAVSSFPPSFDYVGQFYVAGQVPGQLLVFAAVAGLVALALARSWFGRWVYAVGHNELASRFAGIPVTRTKVAVYVIAGLLVALAALIYTSRVSTARANAGMGLELSVIAAVVLGGTDIRGGTGTIAGTVLGVLVLAALQNGLTLAGVPTAWSLVAVGGVLIAGVYINEAVRRN